MAARDAKKTALTELERLKKDLKGVKYDLDALEQYLTHLPLFKNITYKSLEKGVLECNYASMTLRFLVKNGIIEICEKVDLWNDDGVGYIGQFTVKTLKMECSDEKELD